MIVHTLPTGIHTKLLVSAHILISVHIFRIWSSASYGCYSCTIYLRFILTVPSCPANATCTNGIVSCPPGFGFRQNSNNTCVPCAVGFYKASADNSACLPCPSGTYQPNSGQSGCLPQLCPGNATCSTTGFQCNDGYFLNATTNSCQPCSPGSFKSTIGNGTCDLCPTGSYQPAAGQSACLPCAAQNSVTLPGQSSCFNRTRSVFISVATGSIFYSWFAGFPFSNTITVDLVPGTYVLAVAASTYYYGTGVSAILSVDGVLFRSTSSTGWTSTTGAGVFRGGFTIVSQNTGWNSDINFDDSKWTGGQSCSSLGGTGATYNFNNKTYPAIWYIQNFCSSTMR